MGYKGKAGRSQRTGFRTNVWDGLEIKFTCVHYIRIKGCECQRTHKLGVGKGKAKRTCQ